MREIQTSKAKTHLPQLPDDVERGETILITRDGQAVANIRAMRKSKTNKLTLDEILASRHEGHRY